MGNVIAYIELCKLVHLSVSAIHCVVQNAVVVSFSACWADVEEVFKRCVGASAPPAGRRYSVIRPIDSTAVQKGRKCGAPPYLVHCFSSFSSTTLLAPCFLRRMPETQPNEQYHPIFFFVFTHQIIVLHKTSFSLSTFHTSLPFAKYCKFLVSLSFYKLSGLSTTLSV